MRNQTETIITATSRWYLLDFVELWKYRELLYIFSWRDIKVRYKQTAVGIAWVLFQPLVSMAIFTVFFGNFAKIPSQNLPYPIFVMVGLIFWGFFSTGMSHAANAFIENDQLVKKVYFPREILVFSAILTASIDFVVSSVMLVVLFAVYRITPSIAFFLMFLVGTILTMIASCGVGLLLASVNIKYRDVRYIIPFFLQLMMFVTPVIYPLNIIRPSFQYAIASNPMTGVIDGLRTTLATGAITNPLTLVISCVSSGLILLLGLIYFRKTVAFFADVL